MPKRKWEACNKHDLPAENKGLLYLSKSPCKVINTSRVCPLDRAFCNTYMEQHILFPWSSTFLESYLLVLLGSTHVPELLSDYK
mgnify:FL=1|jgi:hypothetical protein